MAQQLPESELRLAEEAVRRDLPGWKLSETGVQHKKAATGVADGLSVKRVGDLEQLRKKFLESGMADAGVAPSVGVRAFRPASAAVRVSTVLVEPVDGGNRKLADVVNGHATIVQG